MSDTAIDISRSLSWISCNEAEHERLLFVLPFQIRLQLVFKLFVHFHTSSHEQILPMRLPTVYVINTTNQ